MYVSYRQGSTTTGARTVGPVVLALGTTSLLTDLSTEMVTSVLPIYLIAWLGAAPWQLGLVEAMQQGVTVLVRLASAWGIDRTGAARPVALVGYALSAVARLPLIALTGIGAVAAAITIDRVGKGIRTAPRDALVAANAPPGRTATAFGVHRALDGLGALLGPVVAFVLLTVTGGSFGAVFVVSAAVAATAVVVLWTFVPAGSRTRRSVAGDAPADAPAGRGGLRGVGVGRLAAVIAALSACVVADSVVVLALQRRLDLPIGTFPLLFVLVAGTAALASVPVGRWVDRAGPRAAVLAGQTLFGLVAALVALDLGTMAWAAAVVVVLGLAHAATDGVLAAYTAAVARPGRETTAQGVTQTAVALGRVVGALAFGWAWQMAGVTAAAWAWAALAGAAVVVGAFMLPPALQPAQGMVAR